MGSGTLRKPSISLPRLRLGHITGAYAVRQHRCLTQIVPSAQLRIRPSRYTQSWRKSVWWSKKGVRLPSEIAYNLLSIADTGTIFRDFVFLL